MSGHWSGQSNRQPHEQVALLFMTHQASMFIERHESNVLVEGHAAARGRDGVRLEQLGITRPSKSQDSSCCSASTAPTRRIKGSDQGLARVRSDPKHGRSTRSR